MYQQGRWDPEPLRGVETRRCISKDAGTRKEWARGETLFELSTLVGEENETPFIRVWKPFPNRHVKGKPIRGNLEGKAQRGQYLEEFLSLRDTSSKP